MVVGAQKLKIGAVSLWGLRVNNKAQNKGFHPAVLWCCWSGDRKGIWRIKVRDVHEAFLLQTEVRPRPWSPRPRLRPRRWQFKPRQDRDQGLQSSRPRRGWATPTPRRDQDEALLHLKTASRPRRQDWGHIPHPHHSQDWCSPKKKWGKPRTEAELKWHIQA